VSDAEPTVRRERTRQRLLDAAALVFAEVGLDAASVEAVCERAGFTRGAFYSNFETKDELFLELAGRVATERVEAVKARVAELEQGGYLGHAGSDPVSLVQSILDIDGDDRLGILLMSEIRIHALRTPALGLAYLAQEAEMVASVSQITSDIAAANGLAFRLPVDEISRLLIMTWEGVAVRAAMAGLDDDATGAQINEALAVLARLLLAEDSAGR